MMKWAACSTYSSNSLGLVHLELAQVSNIVNAMADALEGKITLATLFAQFCTA